MFGTRFFQQVHHILKVLNMAALIGADGDALSIFLQCSLNHFGHRAVVGQMDNFNTSTLKNTTHNINRRIVAIKKAGSGNKAQWYALLGSSLLGSSLIGGSTSGGGGRRNCRGAHLIFHLDW